MLPFKTEYITQRFSAWLKGTEYNSSLAEKVKKL